MREPKLRDYIVACLLLSLPFVLGGVVAAYTYTTVQPLTSTSVNGGFTLLLWNSTSTRLNSTTITSSVSVAPRTSTFQQNETFLFSEGTSVTTTYSLGPDAYLTTTYLNASATQTFTTQDRYTYTYPPSWNVSTTTGNATQLFTAECGAYNSAGWVTQCGQFVLVPEFNGDLAVGTLLIALLVIAAVGSWYEYRYKKRRKYWSEVHQKTGGDIQT